jgi:hypothetical protein
MEGDAQFKPPEGGRRNQAGTADFNSSQDSNKNKGKVKERSSAGSDDHTCEEGVCLIKRSKILLTH